MSEDQNETTEEVPALLNADAFYESEPEVPTEAGESPEVEMEAVEPDEVEATETVEAGEEVNTRYSFDEDSGEYTFKAAGKDVSANVDKLIELASKGVGFDKKVRVTKQNDQKRAQEHAEALAGVNQKISDLDAMISSVEGLLGEDKLDESLLEYDTTEYLKQQKRINDNQSKIEAAKNEVARLREAEAQTRVSKELNLFYETMGWETQEEAEEGLKPINDYLVDIGVTAEEMQYAVNHKILSALSDAAKYREIQSKQAETVKQVKQAPKAVKSKAQSKPAKEKSAADVLYGT